MMITGENEVAVDNQLRRAEKQNQSPVTRLLECAESATQAISLAKGSVAVGCIAKAFGIARRFTSELGVATLSENLDHLGDATETALSRVEKNLYAQGVRIDEIERRLNSKELFEGIKTATLQAQRTKDKKRLERMALILANGVAEKDLEPDSLDDMMRAAVELKEVDIGLLGMIYESQKQFVRQSPPLFSHQWCEKVIAYWEHDFVRENRDHLAIRGSLSRLQSTGLIAEVPTTASSDGSLAHQPFGLLLDGAKFYERLQEISVKQ